MSLGRPRDGKEIKKIYSVRLEPKMKDRLVKKYGSLLTALIRADEVKKK